MKNKYFAKLKRFHLWWALFVAALIFVVGIGKLVPGTERQAPLTKQADVKPQPAGTAVLPSPVLAQGRTYPVHTNIIATMFYIGEPGSPDNGFIPNTASTWDEQWQAHYGGIDSPTKRSGWWPADFTPKQNPFYIALPYNDLDENDVRKASARAVYWAESLAPGSQSLVKDRWIEICRAQACAYGQWEDAGPYGEEAAAYVFGTARPTNTEGLSAGIDVSPALNDYLGLHGEGRVQWRFIDQTAVPAGPWLDISR
jgi:hypothetical protein